MKSFDGIINPGKITNYVSCRPGFADFNEKKQPLRIKAAFNMFYVNNFPPSEIDFIVKYCFLISGKQNITENTPSSCRRILYRVHLAVV